jgi:hypothetical protein
MIQEAAADSAVMNQPLAVAHTQLHQDDVNNWTSAQGHKGTQRRIYIKLSISNGCTRRCQLPVQVLQHPVLKCSSIL